MNSRQRRVVRRCLVREAIKEAPYSVVVASGYMAQAAKLVLRPRSSSTRPTPSMSARRPATNLVAEPFPLESFRDFAFGVSAAQFVSVRDSGPCSSTAFPLTTLVIDEPVSPATHRAIERAMPSAPDRL